MRTTSFWNNLQMRLVIRCVTLIFKFTVCNWTINVVWFNDISIHIFPSKQEIKFHSCKLFKHFYDLCYQCFVRKHSFVLAIKCFVKFSLIPMGTNCAPLIADLILCSYESHCMVRNIPLQMPMPRWLLVNNYNFLTCVKDIYPSELALDKANITND